MARLADVKLVPARDQYAAAPAEEPPRERQPLRERARTKPVFDHFVIVAPTLRPDLLDPPDHTAVACAHTPAEQILQSDHGPAPIAAG